MVASRVIQKYNSKGEELQGLAQSFCRGLSIWGARRIVRYQIWNRALLHAQFLSPAYSAAGLQRQSIAVPGNVLYKRCKGEGPINEGLISCKR